jgi:hypothetical protein
MVRASFDEAARSRGDGIAAAESMKRRQGAYERRMRTMSITRSSTLLSLIIIAIGALAACGGGAPAVNQAAGSSAQRIASRSWMDPAAKSKALLYVSDEYAQTVNVYGYPSLKPVGVLSGFLTPEGLCVNEKTGDVWVTDTLRYSVYEFAHGGTTPIRTIDQPYGYVQDCSVNPVNGDLAIANITYAGDDPGDVAIYKNGSGKPATYSDKRVFEVNHLAYDNRGNLFVDGFHTGSGFRLAELPAGGTKLEQLHWRGPHVKYPGGVQYDGTSVTIGDSYGRVIYQTTNGVATGKTKLQGACWVGQYYIDGATLIVPSACTSNGTVLLYKYPRGGSAVKTIAGFQFPSGAVVSR